MVSSSHQSWPTLFHVSEFGDGPQQQQQEKLLTVHLSRSDDSLMENLFMAACLLFASIAQ